MNTINLRELTGGLLTAGLGAAFAIYAVAHYSVGTVTRMGPGMAPVVLGALLTLFGIVIAIGARWSPRRAGQIRVYVPAVILGCVVAFAALINPFGLMPAIFVSVVIATFAEGTVRPLVSIVLGLVLCLTAWAIFVVALQLPLTLFKWPL